MATLLLLSRRRSTLCLLVACAMAIGASPALATPPSIAAPEPAPSSSPGPPAALFSNLKKSNALFGDLFGIRPALSKRGISLTASETSEELGNLSGGMKRGFAYDGLTQAALQLDTQRAFGWYGGLFNASALQIHGSNLSANNLGTLQTASGIETDRATRLWELWYQQQLLPEDKLNLRIGRQSLDQEFMANQNAGIFVNTMFGWPMLPSADMPDGGPAYPLAASGIRFRARPNNSLAILGGLFNGTPDRFNGGILAIGEAQFRYPGLGAIVYADRPEPLARTIKVGAWYNSEQFPDLAVDSSGLPLANPAGSGIPRMHQGNYSVYATVDQMLAQDQRDPYKTMSAFARVMDTPLRNENTIAFSLNAGLTLHEPIRHRRDDTLGIGMGYTKVTGGTATSDADIGRFTQAFSPIRGSETFAELTYQMQVRPWIQVQPDFQYVFNPGAGVVNPNLPNQRIKNEAVIGIRTIIQL